MQANNSKDTSLGVAPRWIISVSTFSPYMCTVVKVWVMGCMHQPYLSITTCASFCQKHNDFDTGWLKDMNQVMPSWRPYTRTSRFTPKMKWYRAQFNMLYHDWYLSLLGLPVLQDLKEHFNGRNTWHVGIAPIILNFGEYEWCTTYMYAFTKWPELLYRKAHPFQMLILSRKFI